MGTDRARPDDAYHRRVSYAQRSREPLHILAFLLPMLILYELGSILYLSDPGVGLVRIVEAQGILAGFFRIFGVAGLHLPAVVLVVVLLLQHILSRHRWALRPRVLPLMALESAALALPLLLVALLLTTAPLAEAGDDLDTLSWQARGTIALGAGLYEELLFRMVLIEAIHLIAADLLRLRETTSRILAVVLSALAFAAYHDLALPGGGLDTRRALFMLVAGLYFGLLYLARGFGIAVGVHAAYDLVVLLGVGAAQPALDAAGP